MGGGDSDKLKQVFFAVCEAPPKDRTRILDEMCVQDHALRAEVEALLAADGTTSNDGGFLEMPALGPVLTRDTLRALSGAPAPTIVCGYELLRVIGEGGMGVVYEARQNHPWRLVALKMIRPGVASRQAVERFRREADVLARLRHVGIAQVYEAGLTGETDPPQPYFAMELVHGAAIDEYANARNLDERERLALVARVCDAVQHAHERGVIHRDLKPGNILVDDTGQPKVLDFGVSRAMDADAQALTVHTTPGQLIGTIPYMSPEQVAGNPVQVDALSDVYSLGVICYELLAGRLPYDLRNRPLPEAVRIIQEVDPSRLSSIHRGYRGDIETIVGKALEKHKGRRYPSAGEMAADIRRFLADQPLVARPASAFYQLRKFARRNKALVGGVIGIVLALTVGLVGMWRFAQSESRLRHIADIRLAESQRLAYRVSIAAAAQAIEEHQLAAARRLLEDTPPALRNWEWHYFFNRLESAAIILHEPVWNGAGGGSLWFEEPDGILVNRRSVHPGRYASSSWNLDRRNLIRCEDEIGLRADGPWIARLQDHVVHVVDLRNNQEYALRHAAKLVEVGFHESRPWFVTLDENGVVHLWEKTTPLELCRLNPSRTRNWVGISPGNKYIAVGAPEEVFLIDVASRHVSRLPAKSTWGWQVTWSHDDALIAVGIALAPVSHEVWVWRSSTGETLPALRGHTQQIGSIFFAPDSRHVITSCMDGKVRVFDVMTGSLIRTLAARSTQVQQIDYHESSRMIAAACISGEIECWNFDNGREVMTLRGHTAGALSVRFSRDGRHVASAARDGSIRIWDLAIASKRNVIAAHDSYIYPVVFSPDGSRFASGSWDKTVRIWDVATQSLQTTLTVPRESPEFLTFSPDGQRILAKAVAPFGDLTVWNIATGQVEASLDNLPDVLRTTQPPSFFDDSKRVWLPGPPSGNITVWNVQTGELTCVPASELRRVYSNAIDQDRHRVAVISHPDGQLVIADRDTGRILRRMAEGVIRARFCPDGRRVATISKSKTAWFGERVTVWDIERSEPLATLIDHAGDIFNVTFSPDGSRIVTCGRDGMIRFWDADTFDEVAKLRGHSNYVYSVEFSPDGSTLISGSGDGTVRVWTSKPARILSR